ncbi:MAG: MFS transporter [Notoacmeibacter sp.]
MSGPSLEVRKAKAVALNLAAIQAIIGSAAPIAISTGGLAGFMLLGADKSLATAPAAGFSVGIALGALPAAFAISALGRRGGFTAGAAMTGLGGLVACLALIYSNFWVFALGLVFIGIGGAFVQQYRFAAADASPPEFKPKAISWVLFGGVFTAILGPQIVILSKDLFAPFTFAGAYAGVVVLAIIGALLISFLNAPEPISAKAKASELPPRSRNEIIRQPVYAVGLICAIGSYTLMTFLMTGAPIAMVAAGCTQEQAFLGISWHVLAMYAPSFFTGSLIVKFGRERIIIAGLATLLVTAFVGLHGETLWHFWVALILLGLGWNFSFIGATAMVADSYRQNEKGTAQGFHDAVLFGLVAFASLMSGVVFNAGGWHTQNFIVFPVIAICLGALFLLSIIQKRERNT